jgi:hypothetical protein
MAEAAMFANRLIRYLGSHTHQAATYAMLPLVMLNGWAMIGCGCNGGFDAVCGCHCGTSTGGCCGHQHTDSCCGDKAIEYRTGNPAAPEGAHGHQCTQMAVYILVPAIVANSSSTDNDLHASTFAVNALDAPLPPVAVLAGGTVESSLTPPPVDLVVTFHRLVI